MKRSEIKCCHLTSVHSPTDVRIFYREAQTLRGMGYEVVIVAPADASRLTDGIRIEAVPKRRSRYLRIVLTPWDILKRAIRENALIYHFHDPELLLVGLLLKLTGKRVIYDVHEDYKKSLSARDYLPKTLRSVVASAIDIVEKAVSRAFDLVIAATEDIAGQFAKRAKVVVVHNYPLMRKENASLSESSKSVGRPFDIVYAGGLSPERGIAQMIKAVGMMQGVRLTLCGKYESEVLEHSLKQLSGYHMVRYLGHLEHDDLTKILRSSDVGLVCLLPTPRYITALPTKLFEYMESSLPVVASGFPLWKTIVEGNKCGICVNPESPDEIARAVRYLMKNKDERESMGRNGRKAVATLYNWDNEANLLIDRYDSLAGCIQRY